MGRLRQSDRKRIVASPKPATVMVRAGTEIKAKGKLFATLTRDVIRGQRVMPGDFVFADGVQRNPGDEIPPEIVAFLQMAPKFEEPKQ